MADKTVTPANVLPSINAVIGHGTAGATLARTAPLIYQDTDDTWKPAKANSAAPIHKAIAWLLNDAGVGQPVTYVTFDPNFKPGFSIAVHEIIILSGVTAGRPADLADNTTGWYLTAMLIGIGSDFARLQFMASGVPKP